MQRLEQLSNVNAVISEPTLASLQSELAETRQRLAEAEQTLHAIRNGQVDAIIVQGVAGPQAYTLKTASEPYRQIVEQMPEAALTVTADGLIVYCNAAFANMVGRPPQRLPGSLLAEFVAPDALQCLLTSGGNSGCDLTLVPLDGGVIDCHASSTELPVGGEHVYCCVITNLTGQRLKVRHDAIVQTTSNAVYLLSADLLIETWNPGANRLFGYRPDEIIGHSITELVPPDEIARLDTLHWRAGATHLPITADVVRRRKDGALVEVMLHVSPMRDGAGVLTGYVVAAHDISERKRAEEKLRESETRYRMAIKAGGLATWETDIVSGQRLWSPEGLALFGLDLADGIGQVGGDDDELIARVHPDDRHLHDRYGCDLREAGSITAEYRIVLPNGDIRWMAGGGRVLTRDSTGDPVKSVHIATDITERYQAAARLRASEELAHRQLAEIESIYASAQVGLCVLDRQLRFRRINDRLAELNGVPARDHIGRTVLEVLPSLAGFAAEMAGRVFGNGESITDVEVSGETPAQPGLTRTWVQQWLPFRDGKGAIVGISIVVEDVTERKRAEEAVRTSEVRYRRLFEAAHDGVLILDAGTGQITDANPFMVDLLGVTRAELLGQDLWQIGFLGDEAASCAAFAKLKKEGQIRYEHLPLEGKTGNRRDVEVVANIYDEGGHQVIQCNVRDIGERVRATEALRESEARLRLIIDGIVAFIGILDVDGTLREANAYSLSASGLTRGDVVGRKFWDCAWWCHDKDEVERLKTAVAKAAAGDIVRYDAVVRVAGDNRMTIDFMLSPVFDAEGRVELIIPSGLDISDRLRAQQSLLESEERLRTIVTTAQEGIWAVDRVGQTLFANPRMSELLGEDADLIGARVADFLFDEDREVGCGHVAANFEGRNEDYEFRFRRKDGRAVHVLAATAPLKGGDGEIIGALGGFIDLAERKRAEERQQILMRELAHRGKNLLSVIQSIANRTLTGNRTLSEARTAFGGRLQALANTYGSLTDEAFEGAPIAEIVSGELSSFGARAHVEGPEIMLTAKVAQTMALVIHELATNAAKYGALSVPAGKLSVTWTVCGDSADRRFLLDWHENGGPPAKKPSHHGFGTILISTVAAGEFKSTPQLDYTADGFKYRIDAPLAAIGTLISSSTVRSKLRTEILQTFFDAWARSLGSHGALPALDRFDRARFAATGGFTLAEVAADGSVHFVEVGHALQERLGRRLGPAELRAEDLDILKENYRRCAGVSAPCYEHLRFGFGGGEFTTFERLLLPFSRGGKRVTHIAGLVVYSGATREPGAA